VGHHVTGIFSDAESAERAVRDLIEGNFNPNEISIAVADRAGTHEEVVEHDTGVAEGAATGAALGSLLGMLGATLVATGIVVAPQLTVFATGPLLAALRGALGGMAVGLEIGALAGLGFWNDEAHIHAVALKKGGIVVAVPAQHQHADRARKVFLEAGADEVRG
jgi:hypothetical protein